MATFNLIFCCIFSIIFVGIDIFACIIIMPVLWARTYPTSKYVRTLAVGSYFNLPHFCLDRQQFWSQVLFRKASPLLTVIIGKQLLKPPNIQNKSRSALGKMNLVTLKCYLDKPALGKSIINSHRSHLFKRLNEMDLKLQGRCVQIQINPLCKFVPSQQLSLHLKSVLEVFKSPGIKIQTKNFSSSSLFSCLFPLDLQRWLLLLKNDKQKWLYFNQAAIKSGGFSSRQSSGHYFVAHHYMLHLSKHPFRIYEDLRDFHKLLSKFHFLDYISLVRKDSQKKKEAAYLRLVKILKWRSQQSEYYLLFLLRCHSAQQLMTILSSFMQVYQQFVAWRGQKK